MADAPANTATQSNASTTTAVAPAASQSLAEMLRSKVTSSNLASENYKKAVAAAEAAQKATDAAAQATTAAKAATDAAATAQEAAKKAQAQAETLIKALGGQS